MMKANISFVWDGIYVTNANQDPEGQYDVDPLDYYELDECSPHKELLVNGIALLVNPEDFNKLLASMSKEDTSWRVALQEEGREGEPPTTLCFNTKPEALVWCKEYKVCSSDIYVELA